MGYDTLVVGSGPNGLAAAITLAQAGRRVLVLEAAAHVGGAVATEELTLPGFRHDTFSAVYPAAAASPVFSEMPLHRHGLRWVHPAACYAHPLGGGRALALYRDLDRTVAGLESAHPGDGERWRAFAEPFLARFGDFRDTTLAGFPPLRGSARLAAGLGVRRTLDSTRLLLSSAQSYGESLLAGEDSRAWLYGSAIHSGLPLTAAGSAIAAVYLNLLGHRAGWPSPAGGAGMLAAALLGHLRELGGEVRTEAQVIRLPARDGRIAGVELAGGERLAAPLVIADVMPGALATLAEDALRPSYRRALRRYRLGPATLKVDWALDGPIPWSAHEVREAGTVHVGGPPHELLEASALGAVLPARPFMLLGQQSIADPSRAPAGKHTAWAYAHGRQSIDWRNERSAQVQRMEAQIECFAPGFREQILARHVLAPEDLQRRNANLVGGDVGGGSYALGQLLFRPMRSLAPYRTPLRGLYLGSAATFPGGAVHGVCGRAAARLALAEARLTGLGDALGHAVRLARSSTAR